MDRELENYQEYLNMISEKIEGFFKKQEPYIFCTKGCSYCCERGEYPFSEIEYKYILEGMKNLPPETIAQIEENARQVKKEKSEFNMDLIFLYKCPLLINGECSVYDYRGIVCRAFGLMSLRKGKKSTIPFCSSMGLNYSNIYDKERHAITPEMYKLSGIEQPPLFFNVDYSFLTNEAFAEYYGFDFGEKRRIMDWF